MPRKPRRRLKFDEDSVNMLLQEIYDDTYNIRAKIARLFSKWESKIKENVEISEMGDQIIKLINAEAKNQDQKIMLLRYLKEVVFEKSKAESAENNTNNGIMTSQRKNELLNMVRKEFENKEK